MWILSLLCLVIWLVLIPFACGLSFCDVFGRRNRGIATVLICGHLLMTAAFQMIYIPFLLWYNHFQPLVLTYAVVICAFAVFSVVRNREKIVTLFDIHSEKKISSYILWGIAALLIGLQLYKAVFYQYPDHDDAFYAVVSVITNTNNDMYLDVPYTGETSSIDVRHAFSGHPIYISFLARVCGMHPTIVSHTVIPAVVIALSYMLMKKMGDILLPKYREYVPVFLIFVSLMQIYGNATIYTAATFFLTRTSQGKAVIGSVAVPAALLGMAYIGQLTAKREARGQCDAEAVDIHLGKKSVRIELIWIYMAIVFLMGAYCSSMAMFLIPLMAGGVALLYAVVYKNVRVPAWCVASMMPMAVLGVLYFLALGGW